jgi:Flp pilus assembly protein TadG
MTSRRIRRALRRDDGTLTLFTAIAAIGLLAVLAFVVDAGDKLQAGAEARALAEEAARAGAGQVNVSAALAGGGPFSASPAQAVAAARQYLSRRGHTGTVIVTGNRTIQVTVTVTEPAVFTSIIGIPALSATETATASLTQGITGAQGQP